MRSVRFVETHDGLSLAWARSGSGPPLVKASAWLTHLEHDDTSPLWSHFVQFFERSFDYLRYDERGCGLSDRKTGELTVASWTDDLERVVEAAKTAKPFTLIAMSQGTGAAVSYAARHPDAVSKLIILGGYARGAHRRGNPEAAALYDGVVNVFRMGFDLPNEAFREVMTRRFVPDGDPERIHWFNELCRRTTTPDIGAALMTARGQMDVSDQLAKVTCPTLVLHAENDNVAPLDEGRFLARNIPNAELVVLPSANHILQEDERAWQVFCNEVLRFAGPARSTPQPDLTPREAEILDGICAAKSNKEIARDLGVSDKTIRNQVTRIFEKIGVQNRQEAILKARGTPPT